MGVEKRSGFFSESSLQLKKSACQLLLKGNFQGANKNFLLAIKEDCSIEPDILIEYEKILLKKKHDLRLRISFVEFLEERGYLQEVIEELKNLTEEEPTFHEPFVKLAEIYFKAGLIDEVISLYEKAPVSAEDSVIFLENVATCYLKKGNFQKAVAIFEKLAKKFPKPVRFFKILGELYLNLKEYEKAAEVYQKIIEIDKGAMIDIGIKLNNLLEQDPKNHYIIKILGDFYLKTLKPDLALEQYKKLMHFSGELLPEAQKCLQKTLDVYPHYPPALIALAELKLFLGELSEAVSYLEKIDQKLVEYSEQKIGILNQVLSICPGQVMAHKLLVEVYLTRGQLSEALKEIEILLKLCAEESSQVINFCQQILKIDPKNFQAQVYLAEAYLLLKNYKKAQEFAENLLKIDKNHATALRILADVSFYENKLEEAFALYERALSAENYNFLIHKKFKETGTKLLEKEVLAFFKELEKNPWRTRLHLELGIRYYKLGNFSAAIKHLQKSAGDLQLELESSYYLGLCFFEQGIFEKAYRYFKKIFNGDSKKNDFHFNQAMMLAGFTRECQGKIKEAIEIYKKLEEKEPDLLNFDKKIERLKKVKSGVLKILCAFLYGADLHFNIGGVYSFYNEQLKKGDLKVSFGDTYNNRGFMHFQAGDLIEAEEEFSLAIQLDPELVPAWNNFGVLFLKQGNYEEARKIFEKIIAKNNSFYPALNNLGVLYFMKGDFKKARNFLGEALKEDYSGVVWLNLGDLFYSQGEIKEAVFAWQKAKDFSALLPVIQRKLQYLKIREE